MTRRLQAEKPIDCFKPASFWRRSFRCVNRRTPMALQLV